MKKHLATFLVLALLVLFGATAARADEITDWTRNLYQSAWTPLITTPNHPEYTSGHSCASGAAGRVLANQFGDNTPFSIDSDSPAQAGVTRFFTSFSIALEEVKNARIFGGIHFRTACDEGQILGLAVADYVLRNALAPLHGKRVGQSKD